jgi:hypothetical protein
MNELLPTIAIGAVFLVGFFIGQSRLKSKIAEAKADANNDGWTSCEIELRDKYHFHRKRKGSK